MTTVSARSSRSNRRWAHTVLGTAAAVTVGVATVLVGAQLIGVAPPASATSPYCHGAYPCLPPGADPLIRHGPDPLVPYGPAIWNSRLPAGPVSSSNTGSAV
jgi:hypothetical protein